MTNKQKEKIKDNLNAYKANFGYIEIASMKNKKSAPPRIGDAL